MVTAGGRISGPFALAAGTTIKALVSMGGDTLLDRVLKALWESGRVQGPVVVVGPVAVAELGSGATLVEEGETGPQNMVRGLQTLSPTQQKGWALLCTCDLPLLSGESVNWLLD
ncbi:MAG: NTP transferase domain-containing protein, partial [Cytophagales bacterium]|nr:NTP transferase domain-containing protein [Armatimonadota bacterium]